MNYRLQRKRLRLTLNEVAPLLGVEVYALWQYEQGVKPWPQGLRENYLLTILNRMAHESTH